MERIFIACIATVLLYAWPVSAADAAANVKVNDKGNIVYQFLNAYDEAESDSFSSAYVDKDGIIMVPSVSVARFKNAIGHSYNSGSGIITISDKAKSQYYEMKVGSDKVAVLDKNKIKQSEFTLSTDVSLHLVGDYPCYPLDFFQKIGYKAEFDGKRTITFDFVPKAEEKKEDPQLVPFSLGSKFGYMNAAGTVVIEPDFDGAQPFSEGLAAVKADGKWGYIDSSGSMVALPQYDTISAFSEGLAVVGQYIDGKLKYGYLHKSGKLMKAPEFDYALPFSEGYGAATYGHTFFYMNQDGIYVLNRSYEDTGPFSDGLSKVAKKDSYGYINKRGDEVITLQYENGGDFSEGLAAVRKNAKWGYIDKTGATVIPHQYEHAGPFTDSLAAVKSAGGLYGLIDNTGKPVVAPQFEAIGNGHNGYWPAKSAGKWGYIDAKGSWIIAPSYDFAYGAASELFSVRTGDRNYYVNSQGAEVVPRDASGKEYVQLLIAGRAMEVNGKLMELLDNLPAVIEGITYVPAQPVLEMERAGLRASWNADTQTLTATRSGLSVALQAGNAKAQVNGADVELAAAPVVVDGILYVPASFLKGNVVSRVDYADYRPVDLTAMGMEQTWNDFAEWADLYNNADSDTRLEMALQIEEDFNALEAAYAAKFQAEPNNDAAYMEYAVLLGELAQMFELDELWAESANMARKAAQLDGRNASYYNLYVADQLMMSGPEKSAQYGKAAEADPYLVLNHAWTSGMYYDAGIAFGEIDGMSDFAIYCLKLAASHGDEEEQRLAKQLLGDKYHLSESHYRRF
ncbi:hypothetical protein FE783_28260 [Paenibacillus mesophilus]|uniref:WG repeat-containing protein n=1 Tax=Paenibacillus mesophilus TaxID=2582849 RepID=UPI00110E47F8|nr:WG repeat-containing protein [Paenibacillus mesophilus]TMV45826.1 hypothetical protein FE783_28260 [Paenibacillus mesophilus]